MVLDSDRIYHGSAHSFLFTSKYGLGKAVKLELKWVYDASNFNPHTYCLEPWCNRNLYLQTIEISNINHYPERFVKTRCVLVVFFFAKNIFLIMSQKFLQGVSKKNL